MTSLATAADTPAMTLGAVVGGGAFEFCYDDWKYHMAVLGGTGGGKSKFLELFCGYLLHHRRGGILIDPHGDLALNLLAFVAHRKRNGDDELWRRVHYLEIGPKGAFSFDPFATAPRLTAVTRTEYDAWLKAKVDRVCRAMLRRVAEADMEVMNRLKRWLKNVLYACGTALDDRNTHLGIDNALTFTDPGHPDFAPFFETVAGRLPIDVRRDFEKLIGTKRPQDQERWIESTINRLRDLLSPLTKTVLGQHAPSLDVPRIIREQGFVIANLAETPHVSFDEKVVLGGLLIDEVLTAKVAEEQVPEDRRVPFTMVIDESGEFLGEDLKRALGAVRKYKLSLVLAAQDLTTFAKGELDLAPKVLSMCGTVVTFRQTYRKDKEVIVDRVGSENVDFTPHLKEVQRQRGHEFFYAPQFNVGGSRNTSASEGCGVSDAVTDSVTRTTGTADARGGAHADSRQVSDSRGAAAGASETQTRDARGHKRGGSETAHQSVSAAHVEGTGSSDTANWSATTTESEALSRALQKSRSANWTRTEGEGQNWGVTWALVNLPVLESEWERDGLEAGPVADQYERMMQQLHSLRTAEAVVSTLRVRGGFPVKIATVPELWTQRAKGAAVAGVKRLILERHPYNFSPEVVAAGDRRLPAAPPAAGGGGQEPAPAEGVRKAKEPESEQSVFND